MAIQAVLVSYCEKANYWLPCLLIFRLKWAAAFRLTVLMDQRLLLTITLPLFCLNQWRYMTMTQGLSLFIYISAVYVYGTVHFLSHGILRTFGGFICSLVQYMYTLTWRSLWPAANFSLHYIIIWLNNESSELWKEFACWYLGLKGPKTHTYL